MLRPILPLAKSGSRATCYHAAGPTNQADGYCYDAAGNLQGDGQHTYVYDAENRIISVDAGQVKYAYDGDGQRVEKIDTAGSADYVYDLGGHVVNEINSAGAWTRAEIYASGRHLGTYNNGTIYFIQSDWQGTERERVLLTGDPYELCVSLPFGDGLQCVGASDPSPDHFTDKPRDIETGLDYFGARYFSSAMGRWLSPDWSGKPVPVPYAKLDNPQSLNLYSYVHNNPVSKTDPDGHCSAPTLKAGQVGICIDTYIKDRFLPGANVFRAGFGNDRGSAANDPSAGYKQEILIVMTPGAQPQKVKDDGGMSIAVSPATGVIAHKGSSETKLSKATVDEDRTEHFSVSSVGKNGLAFLPMAPKDTIKPDLNFAVTSDGRVGLDPGGIRTAYPSIEIYAYGSDGSVRAIYLKESRTNPTIDQPVPAVAPK